MIGYACRVLSVALPPVYVSPESEGELELRIVLEGQQVVPSFLLGKTCFPGARKKSWPSSLRASWLACAPTSSCFHRRRFPRWANCA
jgi:hypothetical protein